MFEELIAAAGFHDKKLKEGWIPMEAGCYNNIVEVLGDMEEMLGTLSRIDAAAEFRNRTEDLSILRLLLGFVGVVLHAGGQRRVVHAAHIARTT